MDYSLELDNLANDPQEEWQRMLHFTDLGQADQAAMQESVEALLRRGTEFVVGTYDYLRSFPETAAILGWENGVDEEHLEERRRFFSIWLARTLGIDTSEEFAYYLFRAGKYHAGQGPRQIHTPPAYIITSIGMVVAAFSRYMAEAQLPGEVIAPALAGWSKYLSVQLNQMLFGYRIAREFLQGEFMVRVQVFGRLRPLIGKDEFEIGAEPEADVQTLLCKFFNYYPQARKEALDRVWHSEEDEHSMWVEVKPAYVPRRGWRVLLNGRDLNYAHGYHAPVKEKDEIAIFPPGR